MTDIILERTINHTTKPISHYPNDRFPQTFRFALHIKVQAIKHQHRVRRVTEKYSQYYISINPISYHDDGSINANTWTYLGNGINNPYLGTVKRTCLNVEINTNILSKDMLDYLSSIQLKDEDLYTPYFDILKQTIQTKIDLCSSSTCVEHENSLCEEFETLHKKNEKLQEYIKLLFGKLEEKIRLPLLKFEEKIRCLEIENAGQARQLRKTESDIVKLTKQLTESLKESTGLSFTHANTIGQALMYDADIFNCM